MFDYFNLLEHVLLEIEKNIKTRLNSASLAKTMSISSAHLQRLFRFTFERPLARYIRSRKLTASLEDLLMTDLRIIDIANEYGFDYEQTFIRAFKREYGITPGEVRNSGHIIKVTPPLYLINKNKIGDGLLFGPEIVMVPTFHVVGRRYVMPMDKPSELVPKVAKRFWFSERETISNRADDNVYIGLTRAYSEDATYYLPSVRVTKIENVPQGLFADSFNAALCAKFRYIGKHHYLELNSNVADAMYSAIGDYAKDENSEYKIVDEMCFFERIDKTAYDGTYCQLEWFTPVSEKQIEN